MRYNTFVWVLNISILLCLVFSVQVSAVTWTSASGCWTATDGSDTLVMWNSTGVKTWVVPDRVGSSVWYLVVAGGGSGGGAYSQNGGGGGGAGGLLNGTTSITAGTTINVTVGSGGSGGNGQNSSFANTSVGDGINSMGGGAGETGFATISAGGSTGGGSSYQSSAKAPPAGVAGQGNRGGYAYTAGASYGGGGGGGAGGFGVNGTSGANGGGGAGTAISISGSSVIYAAGGGSGGTSFGVSAGGAGGSSSIGGDGGNNGASGENGDVNTGSGGGGIGYGGGASGNGGSGIVIIRYALIPISNFTQNVTTGIAPTTVLFNDTSTNTPTSWQWNFTNVTGNNTPVTFSTSQNLTYTFGIGNWSIILKSTNSGGSNVSTTVHFINVTSPIPPTSSFTVNITYGLFPLAVRFNDTSSGSPLPSSWNWSFGDGVYSDTQNNTHIYSSGGNYTVNLTVTNIVGSSSSIKYITVYNTTTSSILANITSGLSPLAVSFNSTHPNDNATMWNWSFNGGISWTNGTTQNVTTIFNTGGIYTIKTVTQNEYGGYNLTTMTNYITVYDATVSGFSANMTSGSAPLAVRFNVTKPNDNATMWNWSPDGGITWSNGTTQNYSYSYPTFGKYTVIEVAQNPYAINTTMLLNYITVNNATPTASFFANVTSGLSPTSVLFNGSGSTGTGITSWNYSYGDGTWGNYTISTNPVHTYNFGGIYTVNLTVTNDGGSNTQTRSGYITIYNITVSGFTIAKSPGGPYYFNVTVPNDNATRWNWSPDGGVTWTNSTTQNYSYDYGTAYGTYNVMEVAWNPYSTNTTIQSLSYIPPSVIFTATPLSGTVPLYVQFTDTSANTPTTWDWSFGDGSYSTDQNPNHTYTGVGIFIATLNASNDIGFGNYSRTISVGAGYPVSQFTTSVTYGTVPLTVYFTDTSIAHGITAWSWDFGDGITSTLQNPSHIYSTNGVYHVTLTVTDSVGVDTSDETIIYVSSSLLPLVNFVGTPTTISSAPATVQFTDLTQNINPAVATWNWSFGDGSYSVTQNPAHVYVANGQYSITLIVTNSSISNYTTKVGYINIGLPSGSVFANFIATPVYSATVPASIQFVSTSVCTPACTNWAWDLNGDGSTDVVQENPLYTYTYPGNYSPRLIVSNGANSGTKIKSHYVTVGSIYVPTTIPQPTTSWSPGYNNGSVYNAQGGWNIDLANSTYLKYWLQNLTATGNFSIYGFSLSIMAPIMHVFGFWIFLIIWGLYLFAIWIRSQDVTLPLIIGILSIGTFGLLFPKEALPVIIIMFVICGAIIITKLMKE